jgi:hypothetical protein
MIVSARSQGSKSSLALTLSNDDERAALLRDVPTRGRTAVTRENAMARTRKRAKKKTYRSLNVTPSPEKKQLEIKEIVLTLAAPNGEVIKIETLERSGQRRELTDEEFADLAGDDAIDLTTALEHAYATGIADAFQDELGEDDEDVDDILRRFIFKIAAGRQLLRRGAHKLVLGRALHRQRAVRHAHARGAAVKRAIN